MIQQLLAPIALVVGFLLPFTVPGNLAAPPSCTGGGANPDTAVYAWAYFIPQGAAVGSSSGTPAPARADTSFYELGWLRPGTWVKSWIFTDSTGLGWANLVFARRSGAKLVYGCWGQPAMVSCDTLRDLPFDADGDGWVGVSDIGDFAAAYGKPSGHIKSKQRPPASVSLQAAAKVVTAKKAVPR